MSLSSPNVYRSERCPPGVIGLGSRSAETFAGDRLGKHKYAAPSVINVIGVSTWCGFTYDFFAEFPYLYC